MTDNKDLKYTQTFKKEPNVPKTYEQFILEEQILTNQQDLYPELVYEDISEQRGGYGPTDKGKKSYDQQHLINTLNNRWGDKYDLWDEDVTGKEFDSGFKAHSVTSRTSVSGGAGGALASYQADYSAFRYNDDNGDLKIVNPSAGAEIGAGAGGVVAKAELGIDAVNMKTHGVQARIGINADTGFTAGPGGVEVKAAGFGASIGKKTGISTPFGEASIDFEETCNQQ